MNQWASELYEKFFIKTTIAKKNPCWASDTILITSIDLAKREPHKSAILEQEYDLLLVDEAHKLKNKKKALETLLLLSFSKFHLKLFNFV